MSRSSIWLVGLAVVFLTPRAYADPPARMPAPDIQFRSESGDMQDGVRCAAPPVSRAAKAAAEARLAAAAAGKGRKTPTPTPTPNPPGYGRGPNGEIPVVVHVVYKETKRGGREGDVEDWQIEAQIDVLNQALQGTPFQFYLAELERTKNNQWYGNCYNTTTEYEMKQALAVDPAKVLNVYTCKPQQGILGYAYYPWSLPEADVRHGVVALYSSLPGGTAVPYNEGDTVTHEVGHYLGLYHTFEGGCAEPGDYVDDTPAEQSPDFYCSEGRDTCPSAGLDPIHNFMDYGDDLCLVEFTAGQVSRMERAVSVYRPSL